MYNKKKKGRIRLLAGMVAVLLLAGSGLGYVQAENTESWNGQSSQELEETYQNWEIQDVDESLSENSGDDLASDLEAAAGISENTLKKLKTWKRLWKKRIYSTNRKQMKSFLMRMEKSMSI